LANGANAGVALEHSRARKNMRYEARYYGQTSSARLYTGSGKQNAQSFD
jgi:hypothetical protein